MMALSSRLRPLLLAAVAALLLVALAPRALAANTLMAVDLGGEFMKVRERGEVFPFDFFRNCFFFSRRDRPIDLENKGQPLGRFEAPCGSFFLRSILMPAGLFDGSLSSCDAPSSKEGLARGRETARKQGEVLVAVLTETWAGTEEKKMRFRAFFCRLSRFDRISAHPGEHHDDVIYARTR